MLLEAQTLDVSYGRIRALSGVSVALAAGAPVITSNVSSLPEVGGDAARYVDPRDVRDIRAALADLLGDPAARRELAARGPAQAAQFSWARTAAETLSALEAIAAGRPPAERVAAAARQPPVSSSSS